VKAIAKHKLIRRYEVTDAAVHDSQKLDELVTKSNTSADVFGDSAYRSSAIEERLRAGRFKSRIHMRATRKRSLSEAQANANHNRSKIRARVEHVFAAQQTAQGGRIVRTIGIVRARAKIGLRNLAYNIRRWSALPLHEGGGRVWKARGGQIKGRHAGTIRYKLSIRLSCHHASNRHCSRRP
jgi:transposase, IS5 family